MYKFTINANSDIAQKAANEYDVAVYNSDTISKAWYIIEKRYRHEYILTKYGYDYKLRCANENWYCMFSFDGNDIFIEEAHRNGKRIKAESRLKIFEQIVMRIWALKQTGKIS